jgi:hypothetical protein
VSVEARQWRQGAKGELLTDAWCPTCQEFRFQSLGLLWWKPGRSAQADLLCQVCQQVLLQEAYVYPRSLPEPYQFFVVHAGSRDDQTPDDYTVMVAALSFARARYLEQLFKDFYAPFAFTGERFAGHLLH